jgi:hypothetical protein
MRYQLPDNLVRFNMHLLRDHVARLVQIADQLARVKRRDVRLGEALEIALTAGLSWDDRDLLGLAKPDYASDHWLKVGPVNRRGGEVLLPSALAR